MSIQNINTFQNTNDQNLSELTQKYVIEALANLGQRYSIQGDGIHTRTMTFAQILEECTNYEISSYDHNSYIAKVDYSSDNKNIEIKVVDKDLHPIENIELSIPVANVAVLNGEDNIINARIDETNVSRIDKSYMYANNLNFVFSEKEIIVNNEDTEIEHFVCEKYNKYTNRLDSALRIIPYSYTNGTDSFDHAILFMQRNSENEYSLFIYYMNFELLEIDIDQIAKHASVIVGEDVENELESFSPETFLSNLYTISTAKPNFTSIFIKENETLNGIKVTYNNDNKSYFVDVTDLSDNIKKVSRYVQYFAYDQTYMYRQLKKAYSELKYKNTEENSTSSYFILEVIKDLYLLTFIRKDDNSALYIPLDYEFQYSYNSNDPWKMYFSNSDICLRDVVEFNKGIAYTVFSYQDKSGIVRVVNNDVEKTTFYRYNIEYDPENADIIYNMVVNKHFTMPYINASGYWVIDDIDTEVYARGHDAGNPNIVIVETVKGKDTPIILSMSNKDYLESLNWITKEATIDLPKKIERTNSGTTQKVTFSDTEINDMGGFIVSNNGELTFRCQYLVPTLNNTSKKRLEENLEKLQYAIILNISHTDMIIGYDQNAKLRTEMNSIYGEDGRIMTFWVLDENKQENCGYGFRPILNKAEHAADINYMSNFVNTIGWVISNYTPTDPDNFTFTQIVFDNANYNVKQSVTDLFRVYPVIRNESIKDASDNYKTTNNFNLKIEFNDNISGSYYGETDSDYIDSNTSYMKLIDNVYQSDRRYLSYWLDALTNETNEIVSKIYSYQGSDNQYRDYSEYIPGSSTFSIPTLDLGEVFVKDTNAINKVNIVSFSDSAAPYYSYIGTTFEDEDKSVLKIGTSYKNINIGTKTLTEDLNQSLFNTQRELDIEFDNTRITSYAYVCNDLITEHDQITYGTTWRRFDIGNTTYWTTTFRQCGRFDKKYCKLNAPYGYNNVAQFYNTNYEFIAMTVPERYYNNQTDIVLQPFDMYIADMVNVPKLIKTISPTIDLDTIEVNSDNEVIYYVTNSGCSYVGVRLNSAMLNDLYEYRETTEGQTYTYMNPSILHHKVFTSNELEITYYNSNDKNYFTINDLNNNNIMSYVHKIQQQY